MKDLVNSSALRHSMQATSECRRRKSLLLAAPTRIFSSLVISLLMLPALVTTTVNAHPSYEVPSAAPTAYGAAFMAEHFGYGFVGASSSADAYAMMENLCPAPSEDECVTGHCPPKNPTDELARAIEEVGATVAEASLLQKARSNAYEFLVINAVQIETSSSLKPRSLRPPDCIKNEKEIADLDQKVRSLASQSMGDEFIAKLAPDDARLFAKSVANMQTLSGFRVPEALMQYDLLKAAQKSGQCPQMTSVPSFARKAREIQGFENKLPYCLSIADQITKLRDTMPVLFHGEPNQVERRLGKIRSSYQNLLGARSIPHSLRGQFETGRQHYESALANPTGKPIESLMRTLHERFMEASAPDASTPPAIRNSLTNATREVQNVLGEVTSEYLSTLRKSVAGLCSLDLSELSQIAPNVVRQMVLDIPENERRLARGALCEANIRGRFSRPLNCGYTQIRSNNNGTVTSVRRDEFNYPYRDSATYRLTETKANPDLGPLVELEVNFKSDLPNAELAPILEDWESKANNWYNCQTGAIPKGGTGKSTASKCVASPGMSNPPVRFKFNFKRAPTGLASGSTLNVHRCYNNGVTNCEAIRSIQVEQCVSRQNTQTHAVGDNENSKSTQVETLSMCERSTPPAGASSLNRENAVNLTINSSDASLFHELAHHLGLRDEYPDSMMSFRPLGEHDSIMSNSFHPEARLYPRHIEKILEIKECADFKDPNFKHLAPQFKVPGAAKK